MSFNQKSTITYTVWNLDVWGHGPDECEDSLGCPCMADDPDHEGQRIHDPDAHECDAGYDVNDRCRVGTVEVQTDETVNYTHPTASVGWYPSDGAIVRALIDAGYLKDACTASDVDIDGESDGLLMLDESQDGRPLFQLEYKSETAVDVQHAVTVSP